MASSTSSPSPLAPIMEGDHHHGQRHHGGLVDSYHDGRTGQRQLHFEQDLPVIGPERVGSLDDLLGHFADAHIGQAESPAAPRR